MFGALVFGLHYLMQVHALKTATNDLKNLEFSIRDFAISVAISALFRILFDKAMLQLFKMEALGIYDRLVMQDDHLNLTNIVGTCKFQKFDPVSLKTHLIKRLKTIHRCKSKMVKFFGVWYFKEMSDEEFDK